MTICILKFFVFLLASSSSLTGVDHSARGLQHRYHPTGIVALSARFAQFSQQGYVQADVMKLGSKARSSASEWSVLPLALANTLSPENRDQLSQGSL